MNKFEESNGEFKRNSEIWLDTLKMLSIHWLSIDGFKDVIKPNAIIEVLYWRSIFHV
jgi:hypothetical protein